MAPRECRLYGIPNYIFTLILQVIRLFYTCIKGALCKIVYFFIQYCHFCGSTYQPKASVYVDLIMRRNTSHIAPLLFKQHGRDGGNFNYFIMGCN